MCQAFIEFRKRRRQKGKKTDVWSVDKIDSNIEVQSCLGWIQFDWAWRQYVFVADANTKWSAGCMDQISVFLKEQNEKWRKKLRSRK